MSILQAPTNLPQLVTAAFTRARAGNDLNFFPTQGALLDAGSACVQLRFAPSLTHKPKGPKPAPSAPPFDPFATPPPALRITDISSAHFLVLNKFAIAPEHFILATTEWKSQEDVLEAEDIEAAAACIQAYEGQHGGNLTDEETLLAEQKLERKSVFVFFNGGSHSGASQPHRHLQLLPISSLYEGLPADTPWKPLITTLDSPTVVNRLPFRVFIAEINPSMTRQQLFDTYISLYTAACMSVLESSTTVPDTGKALISYNLSMTKDRMVVCPRLAEGSEITLKDNSKGKIQLNGTVMAGTVLVKNAGEWDALKGDPSILNGVFQKIGVPCDGGAGKL